MTIYQSLSQTHLNLFETCPPLFQKRYLEQISTLSNVVQEEKGEWGKKFHLLMQQYHLGLPLDSFVYEDVSFQQSLEALVHETQNIWTSSEVQAREAEYKLQLKFKSYIFTVIYDLLILYPNQAVIYDWKTFLQPENGDKLRNNWQTKLYLYVLAEKMNYEPSQLSMTYWFVKLPHKIQSMTIQYSDRMHEKNRQDINNVLDRMEKSMADYLDFNGNFSHISNCQKKCPYYQLLSENDPLNNSIDQLENLPNNLEKVAEINPF
ncbi:MAG: PD-(D/E)XK nuclease family protein [Cyanobacterium sp.]